MIEIFETMRTLKLITVVAITTFALNACVVYQTTSHSDGRVQVKIDGKCSPMMENIPRQTVEALVMTGTVAISEEYCERSK